VMNGLNCHTDARGRSPSYSSHQKPSCRPR
jgi:hypothetical protein